MFSNVTRVLYYFCQVEKEENIVNLSNSNLRIHLKRKRKYPS